MTCFAVLTPTSAEAKTKADEALPFLLRILDDRDNTQAVREAASSALAVFRGNKKAQAAIANYKNEAS